MKYEIDDNVMYMPVPFGLFKDITYAAQRARELGLEFKTTVIFYWNGKKIIIPYNSDARLLALEQLYQ